MCKNAVKILMVLALASSSLGPARADPLVQRKLGQFGIELRIDGCGKWASGNWPWGGGWKVCVGPNIGFLQHEFKLVVDGPQPDRAALNVLQEAVAVAASAALGTGLLTPTPEPASRIAAAAAAAKAAFVGYVAARGLGQFVNQYEVKIDHRTFW